MTNWKQLAGGVAAAASTAAIVAPAANAQITTSSIRGELTTEAGAPVSGAAVTVRHTPSGTTSTATTNAGGVFLARGLRVGGPYTVTVSPADGDEIEVNDIYVNLDETYQLSLRTSEERTLEKIVVTASQISDGYLDTGLATDFSREALSKIASIDRDIADAAKLDPFASVNYQSNGAKELTIAGANNRFNSLTIDGVALNDRFGLNANGYPTQRSPISFDAIESLSVESAPYDTEFNGFTGGTINAVTKSGTNEFHGSAFYFQNKGDWAGQKIRGNKVTNDFEEKTYGFTIGGPILKDRLFFFGSYEKLEEEAALRNGPAGSGALNEFGNILQSDVDAIRDIAIADYGFDPLQFSSLPPVEDEKILASLDWNITNDHRAKFTYLKTDGSSIAEQNGNAFIQFSQLAFPSSFYERSETVESYIGHVFSDWTDNFSTEVKLAYTEQATGQDSLGGAEFPLMSIRTSTGAAISLGPDRFRHGNSLDQEFLQFKVKGEYVLGDHVLKAGYEREQVDVNNLFAQNAEGTYAFASIADFDNQLASALEYDNAVTNDENDLRAIWGYNYNSFYVQDTWDVLDNVSLLFGLRYDLYESEGQIRQNDNFEGRYGFSNTGDIDGLDVILPRFAATWDATDDLTLRGGIGRFSGGSPSVWISNAYSNDGVLNDGVFATNVTVPTTPDAATGQYIPQAQLDELAALGTNNLVDGSVAALDPSFEIPTTWKFNLGAAYDFNHLGVEGLLLTADVLYNKLENQPYWYDASCNDPIGASPDGRPVYDCGLGRTQPEATLVGSVDKGHSLIWAVSASKDFDWGGDIFFSYTNQDVQDIGQGTSSTATSNYSDTARYSYQVPRTGTSNFQVEHQFKLRAGWKHEFFDGYATKVNMFATRRSGQPYSYTFNTDGSNDVFGIRENRADDAGALLYVPTGANDPLFSANSFGGDPAAQAAFFDYINNSELAQYRGGIADRNGDNSRWSTIVDLRLQQELPAFHPKAGKLTGFLDVENVGNLLNDSWGVIERTRYEYERQVASASIDNGQYVYDNLRTNNANEELLSKSLWQVQVGIKYEF